MKCPVGRALAVGAFLAAVTFSHGRREIVRAPNPVPTPPKPGPDPDSAVWNLRGATGAGYSLVLYLGTPPQKFRVLVDTGSGNMAVAGYPDPAIKTYFNSNNSVSKVNLNQIVSVYYGRGQWAGYLFTDVVYFPELNSIPNVTCPVTLIDWSEFFYPTHGDWQGILGLAYPEITRPSPEVISWIDSVQKQNNDRTVAFSLTLCGPKESNKNERYGSFEMLNNVIQPFNKTLMTAQVVNKRLYEIIIVEIIANGKPLKIDCRLLNVDNSVVDSGSSDIQLSPEVFEKLIIEMMPLWTNHYEKYVKLNLLKQKDPTIRNYTEYPMLTEDFWRKQTILCWLKPPNWDGMAGITFKLASNSKQYFTISILGKTLMQQELHSKYYCYSFGIGHAASTTVLGAVALEGFQVIFNRTAGSVGFMKANCGPDVKLSGLFNVSEDIDIIEKCTYYSGIKLYQQDPVKVPIIVPIKVPNLPQDPISASLNIAGYTVCAILVISSAIFAFVLGNWLKQKYIQYNQNNLMVSYSLSSLINDDFC